MQDLISVIVPVYKVEMYLEKCVKSICNQTYKNLEIILVDDGSPDSCPQLCDTLAQNDERIVVIHKENGGLSDARNAGIKIAKGQYIGFVDSDDYIDEAMYQKLLYAIKNNDADMSVCNYEIVDEFGNVQLANSPIKEEILTAYEMFEKLSNDSWWYYVTAWNKLYKKEIFQNIQFPNGKLHEDQFVAHQAYGECKKIAIVADKMYYYVQRSNSIMNSAMTVSRLDDIEAIYSRYKYYEANGYFDLQEKILPVVELVFDRKRFDVKISSFIEYKRVCQIDKLTKEIVCNSDADKEFETKVKFATFFWMIKRIKTAIRIRSKLKRAKFLLNLLSKKTALFNFTKCEDALIDNLKNADTVIVSFDDLYHQVLEYTRLVPNDKKLVVFADKLGTINPRFDEALRKIISVANNKSMEVIIDCVDYDFSEYHGEAFYNETKRSIESAKDITFITNQKTKEKLEKLFPNVKVIANIKEETK